MDYRPTNQESLFYRKHHAVSPVLFPYVLVTRDEMLNLSSTLGSILTVQLWHCYYGGTEIPFNMYRIQWQKQKKLSKHPDTKASYKSTIITPHATQMGGTQRLTLISFFFPNPLTYFTSPRLPSLPSRVSRLLEGSWPTNISTSKCPYAHGGKTCDSSLFLSKSFSLSLLLRSISTSHSHFLQFVFISLPVCQSWIYPYLSMYYHTKWNDGLW